MGIQAATMGLEVLEQNAYETNKYKDAYIYKTKLLALRDSAQKLGDLNVYESIQTKNSYEQKLSLYEAESVRKEELAALKWQRQKRIAATAVIIFAFLLFLAAVQFRNNNRLKKEKKRSEALLLNILPTEVAEELKEKGSADAKMFNDVTILFTDFKSFTTVSERLTPQQLVDELHACFSAFDRIMVKHRVEKIKTVGDAYLAVSGLPVANANHATDIALAAIEIRDFIKQRRIEKGDKTFDIRIGIHSGSVVAGIVGVKKFAYDIWGDTVNTAARMEQSSEAGRINISEATFNLVKDKFSCQYRGEIEAKNKGKLKMYFLN
jgi:class 3 adenylate cyclase